MKDYRRSKPIHISNIIKNGIGKNPLYLIIKNWYKIVGKIIFRIAVPLKIKKTTLIVGVKTHPWLQELAFSKHIILDKLAEFTSGVKDIQFILKFDLKRGSSSKPKKEDVKEITLSKKDIDFIQNIVLEIHDEELKDIFENILKIKLSRKR